MMEILFKARRVDNGEWVEGFYVFDETHVIVKSLRYEIRVYGKVNFPKADFPEVYVIDPTTLCQYIPILDAFAGDMLHGKETDEYGSLLSSWGGVIKYNEKKGRYMVEDDLGDWYEVDDFQFDDVIGSIHTGLEQ